MIITGSSGVSWQIRTVKAEIGGDFVRANQDEPSAFMETLGVETIYPHQLQLLKSAREAMGVREHLTAVLDSLSDELVAEVRDFAEFLLRFRQPSLRCSVSEIDSKEFRI